MKAKKWLNALRFAVITLIITLISATVVACNKKKAKPGPEVGVYCCYDVGDEPYTLTLQSGKKFTLVMGENSNGGSYKLSDVTLTLTFKDKTLGKLSGSYTESAVTFDMDGVTLTFYKEITYTVSFNVAGGSDVAAVSVVNGKTIAKPTAPTKAGNAFVGWYVDSAFKTPFLFDVQKVTGDTTLYARWVETEEGKSEYEVSFDLNYEGAPNVANVLTTAGKLFEINAPAPTRNGYDFVGWAISMYDNKAKPSYMYVDGMTVAEDITLVAVWAEKNGTKLPTPVVTVTDSGFSWKSINGASGYTVQLIGPDGEEVAVNMTPGSTTAPVPFEDYVAGDYIIKVTANASDTSKTSDTAVRYYKNKALARVSHFSVEGTVISFEGVANATDYAITIDCGDVCHNHVEMALEDGATSYDFSTCLSKRGGIVFTVTASADGYASSTSREYKYVKDLGDVTGLKVDTETGNVVWDPVDNATQYVVAVVCGSHTHKVVYTTATSFSIKECANATGGIVVSVYAMADGYASSVPATVTYDKKVLPTPTNVKIDGNVLSWTAVEGATAYEIKFADGAGGSTETNSFDLTNCYAALNAGKDIVFTIRAIGANDTNSFWSDEISSKVLTMASSLTYNNGVLSWNHVVGADGYEVKQNGEVIATIEDGSNSVNVTFDQAGVNTFEVSYIQGETKSDAVSLEVTSYKVEFDTLVSYLEFPTQYKAKGDYVAAFDNADFNKPGYSFGGWYYDERVGDGNARRYVDQYFDEDENITLYATYTPNTYTVTFDYQGGTAGETTKTVVFSKDFTFPVPTHSDATKTFAGWSTAPNGGGIGLTNDKGKNTVGWPVAENVTVYAHWHANVFKFTKTRLAGSNADVYSVAAGARIATETEVTIPQNYNGLPVKIVEANAFRDCSKLATINIPNTVELIFDGRVSAFTGCTALQNINIIKVEGNKLIRYWSKDGVVFDYGLIDEQNGESAVAFFPMGKTGSYTIPEGVHKVPNEVFKDVMLTSITIASTVKYIGTDAFYSCDDLTEIKFAPTPAGSSASPLEIDSQAFRSCTKLESITFPARLSEIKLTKYELSEYTDSEPPYQNISTSYTSSGVENPFISCSLFKEINVEDGGQYYSSQDGVLFNANKTELLYVPQYKRGAYTIPNGVKKIADGAFAICYYLTGTLTIPNTVETIGECAFYNAYGFKDLVFKGQRFNALTIGKYAFRSASGFTSVVFEATSNVKEIGEGAFYSSGYIKTIEIPASVETIGDQAFRGCWSLGTVTFEASANAADLTFGDAVFYGTRITEFNVPAHAVDLGGVLSGMDKLRKVNVDPNNENYASDADGILFDKDKKTLLYYPKTKTGNYVVPDTVEVIGAGVFTNNSNIVEVTIGKNVKEIGDSAFAYCTRLTTVNFEDNTEAGASLELGARVFYECRAITSIELPVQTKSYGGYCFAYMDSMTELDLNEGLTEMGAYGIYYCPLITTIEIPSTVTATSYYGIAYNYGLTFITFAKNTQGDTAVTEFGSYSFYYNREVTAFEIPKSVKTIGYYGMYMGGSSSKLASVTFEAGSQLEKIGPYAFYYSKKLTTITIPKSVVDIDYYAFAYCGLEEVIFEQGGTAPLYIGRWNTYKSSPSATSESAGYGYVFYNCDNLVRVDFPARLTEMGRYTFYDCKLLETVTFDTETKMEGGVEKPVESKLAQIGEFSFSTCPNFRSIKIPKSVQNQTYIVDTRPGYTTNKSYMYNRQGIGRYVFRYNYKLESVVFEMGGTGPLTIGTGAFEDCRSLTTITIPARLTTYNGYDDPNYGALGGSYKFTGCTSLTEINIDATSTIPENEYLSKDGIVYTKDFKTVYLCAPGRTKAVTIDKDVTRIGNKAFEKCDKITTVTFEQNTEADAELVIGTSAFTGCSAIETITLSDHVTTIEPRAFENCTGLKTVNLSKMLTTSGFDASAFVGCDSLNQIGLTQNDDFAVVDGVLFNKEMTTLYYYPNSKQDTTYTVPTGVVEIYQAAFYGNNSLQKLILPTGMQKIGEEAFYGATALKEVFVPNTVVHIGDYAFYNCRKLAKVDFEKGGESALEIGEGDLIGQTNGTSSTSKRYGFTFAYCYSLQTIELPERTVSIADNTFWYCRGLKNINIPKNVTAIGRYAFYDCERLESVTFASDIDLKKLDRYAFGYCYSLDNFVVPASVEKFDTYVFYHCEGMTTFSFADGCKLEKLPNYTFGYCYSLESIALPENLIEITNASSSASPFYHCDSLESVTFKGNKVEKIGNYAFYYCGSLETFVIPETVLSLGNYVFSYCTSLDNVVIPNTVTDGIGDGLFNYCSSLTNVTLPDNMDVMPNSMFWGCTSLTEIEIPSTVTDFGYSVFGHTGITEFVFPAFMTEVPSSFFDSCENLTKVTLHNNITYIGDYAFAWTGITEIDIPNSVEAIEYEAFEGCRELTRVKLPNNSSFTTLSDYLFAETPKLKTLEIPATIDTMLYGVFSGSGIEEIVIPDSVTYMDGEMFWACKNLKKVTLPGSMSSIPYNTFYDCKSLEEVIIPDNGMFTMVEDYAFYGCTSLESINLPSTTTNIADNAFTESGLTSFTIGDSLRTISETAFFGCKDLATITVSEGNSSFEMVDGILMNEAQTKIIMWTAAAETTVGDTYTIPAGVTLNGGAFAGANIKKVVLPDTLKEIPQYLFYGSTIEEVVFPSNLTLIGQYAFAESKLTTVEIPSTVEKIDNYAFENAAITSLTFAPVPTGKTAVPLVIGSYAFRGAGMTSLVLPYRLRSDSTTTPLQSYAFAKCEELKSVTFESNPATGSVYGSLFIGSSTFEDCINLESVTFPKELGRSPASTSVTSYIAIGSYTFRNCKKLETVTFQPTEGYSIGFYTAVFLNCESLADFSFPETTEYIGSGMFYGCKSLTEMVIPADVSFSSSTWSESWYDENDEYHSISHYGEMFAGCTNLTKVTLNSSEISFGMFKDSFVTTIIINGELTSIGERAFENCTTLTTFDIPASVTSISKNAFAGWTSAQTINFGGTVLDSYAWEITWDDNCDAVINYAQ